MDHGQTSRGLNRFERRLTSSAFTLVELLVVIGIISVLIAMLLPALNKVRQQSLKVNCLSNMRQISVAFMGYVQDNKGWLPTLDYPSDLQLTNPSGVVLNGAQRYNAVFGSGWLHRLVATRYITTDPTRNTAKRDVLFCPADDRTRLNGWSSNRPWYSSYRVMDVYGWAQGSWAPTKLIRLPATNNTECVRREIKVMPLLVEMHSTAAPNGLLHSPWGSGFNVPTGGVALSTPHSLKERAVLYNDWHVSMDVLGWDDPIKIAKRPAGTFLRFWYPGLF